MKRTRSPSHQKHYNQTYFTKRDALDIPVAESIKKFMHDHQLHTVLDVGCGTGQIVKFLNDSGFDAYGCDVSKIAVKMGRKLNGRKKIVHATASKLPFKDRTFDLVISISMIEHITQNQVTKFLQESKRVLRSGGYIFLVTPNFATPLRSLQREHWGGYADPTHINFYTPNSLATTLKQHEFSRINVNIGIPYKRSIGKKYLSHIGYIPDFLKGEVLYLFFSTPLRFMRNSFWIAARSLPTFRDRPKKMKF